MRVNCFSETARPVAITARRIQICSVWGLSVLLRSIHGAAAARTVIHTKEKRVSPCFLILLSFCSVTCYLLREHPDETIVDS
jgi:hypothetical protein